MAPLPVIPDIIRVQMFWTETDGATAANVWHLRTSATDLPDIGAVIQTAWNAGQMHNTSARATITQMALTPLDGSTATYVTPFGSAHNVGAGSAECLIEGCTVVSFRTATRGSKGRGRVYVPFVPEDAQSGGKLIGSNITAVSAGWNTFNDSLAASDIVGNIAVASYLHDNAHDVVSFSNDVVIGIQRRRVQRLRT
jgi:hypothetical protein